MGRVKAELIDGFYVVGDLAYLPEEWERRQAQNARRREKRREYSREAVRRWRAANPEADREHKRRQREHMRLKRLGEYKALQITGSLHDLRCWGPTKDTGCRCKKTLIVREVEK